MKMMIFLWKNNKKKGKREEKVLLWTLEIILISCLISRKQKLVLIREESGNL
jgi:hypothetical protein